MFVKSAVFTVWARPATSTRPIKRFAFPVLFAFIFPVWIISVETHYGNTPVTPKIRI
jgi:hypothetical protein